MQDRCVQWATINGRQHHLVGGKLARAVKNPTWDPIALPGSISDYLRGNPLGQEAFELMQAREPLPDYYINNAARLEKLDEQGPFASVYIYLHRRFPFFLLIYP